MKKLNLILLLTVMIFIVSSVKVNAFFPTTHKYLQDNGIREPIDSEFYNACMKYPALCWSGNVLTDVSVIFYYTQGTLYSTTHSPPFCASLLKNVGKVPGADYSDPETIDKFRSCVVGGCFHQSQDLVSHSDNGLVPYAIEHSFLVNSIIHTFAEQKVDNYVEEKYPATKQESISYLESYKECQPLFVLTMLGESAYRTAGFDEGTLNTIFEDFISEYISSTETGYDPSFKEKNFLGTLSSIPYSIIGIYLVIMFGLILILSLIFIKVLRKQSSLRHYIAIIVFLPILVILLTFSVGVVRGNVFQTFITFIKPVSELVPTGNIDVYMDRAILNTQQLLIEGEIWLEGRDASGRGTNPVLDLADSKVMYVDYIILAVLALLFSWFIWFIFKKEKIKTFL